MLGPKDVTNLPVALKVRNKSSAESRKPAQKRESKPVHSTTNESNNNQTTTHVLSRFQSSPPWWVSLALCWNSASRMAESKSTKKPTTDLSSTSWIPFENISKSKTPMVVEGDTYNPMPGLDVLYDAVVAKKNPNEPYQLAFHDCNDDDYESIVFNPI